MFPSMGSHQVPNMFCKFPMCSPRVFPIAPCFNPICFAQSLPFLTYIGRPKGEPLHLSIKSSILGEPSIVSTCFCNGPIKITHCKKKWLDLWSTPNSLIWNKISTLKGTRAIYLLFYFIKEVQFYCQYGSYWLDVRNGDFKSH
jgi:hypothetical protein